MKSVVKRIIAITLILSACSGEVKNTTVVEKAKPETDTVVCSAIVTNDLILGDTNLVFPKVKLKDSVIAKKINTHFSLENITGYQLDEIKQQKEDFKKDSVPQEIG